MKNIVVILRFVFLLIALITSINTYANPKFSITLTKKAPSTLPANSISTAQYKILNNTKITRTLTMKTVKGVSQIVSGINTCTNPFTLAQGQNCLLTLQLNGNQLGEGIFSGPVICKTKSSKDNIPDPFLCSQPSREESLNVSILPCSSTTCLSNEVADQLRELTAEYKKKFNVPGMLSGIWIPGKQPLIIEYGLSDIAANRPISVNDTFRIGSITKSFVITIILQLVEEGLLDLNSPVEDFLPGIQNGAATIAQLADMTSGIFNYTQDADFVKELFSDLLRVWTNQELIATANINNPYFPPGTDWHYSNTNTVILGMIIEQITGNFLGDEISKRILKPLGLENTSYPTTPDLASPFARDYRLDLQRDFTFTDPSSSAGAGAMIGVLKDLKEWAIALGKGSLLSPTTQKLRINSLLPIIFDPCADNDPNRPKVSCPEYDKYGIGIGDIEGWIGHTGEFIGYTSLIMYEPKSGAVIVIFANIFALDQHIPTKLFRKYLDVLKI